MRGPIRNILQSVILSRELITRKCQVPLCAGCYWEQFVRLASFLLATFPISIRTMCFFHQDDSPTLSPPYGKYTAINRSSPKIKLAKNTLYSQLSNHHLSNLFLLSSSSLIRFQITSDVSLINYCCYIVNLLLFFQDLSPEPR